ncbi:MAG: tol-pal system-associated acyl-CoA thioesterase [Rhodanobacter sp.]|jgi:acyl-CoA thioester hydrolase|nr:tol-pal system-associated acyl-CoA thioesterase [Rhodanobacter sp.]
MPMSEPTPFRWPVRVYWEDTDAGGVVYHASYLRFMERARTEWLRGIGIDQSALKQSTGLAFLVREMQIDFLKPALLDDELSATVEVKERRAASILFMQTIERTDGSCLIRARVRVACVDVQRMRAAPIPADLFAKRAP